MIQQILIIVYGLVDLLEMLLIHFRGIMVLNFQRLTISTIEPQNVALVLGHMEVGGGFIGTLRTTTIYFKSLYQKE